MVRHARLVQALIISRLDYGNALLYNTLRSLTNRLQRVQNSVAPLAKGTYKSNIQRSFVQAALGSCTFRITVQDPVSYIQSTEWNSTSVSK